MIELFEFVREELKLLARITGLSYEAINIVVYFYLIPFLFWIPLDKIINKGSIFKITQLVGIIASLFIIGNFEEFSQRAFKYWADFLHGFGFMGMNYVVASVVICVFIPLVIWGFLLWMAYKKAIKRFWNTIKP